MTRLARRVLLRPPLPGDTAAFLAMVRASRKLHRPWVRPPADEKAFLAYTQRAASERFIGRLVCLRATDEIVGVFHLSEIVRGAFHSAYLSYYGSALHAGQGLMREGARLFLDFAFRGLKLHRVEANIQPENLRSVSLVRALGFRQEGFSPRYLKIAGRWRDHERWALLAEEWRGDGERRRLPGGLS